MQPICSVETCTRPVKYKRAALCGMHYQRMWKTGDPEGIRPSKWDGYERPHCSVDGCPDLAHARGMCSSHFCRHRRHGDPLAGRRPNIAGTLEERFWLCASVGHPADCWFWSGYLFPVTGYSELTYKGKTLLGHRVSYELNVGPIPSGLVLDHLCHTFDLWCPGGLCAHRTCVNPRHLQPVTIAENFRRGTERARLAHKFVGLR